MKIHRHPLCPPPRKRTGGTSITLSLGGRTAGPASDLRKRALDLMGKEEDRGLPVLIPSICEHSHYSASVAAWQVLLGRWWKLPPQRQFSPLGAKHTQWMPLPVRPSHKLCVSRSWYSVVCNVNYFRPYMPLICLLPCLFLFSFFLISYLWQTTVNRLTELLSDWHTQIALLNDRKLAPAAHHVLLTILAAPDILPSILTDYTYDSELDIADGVPLKAFRCSSKFPKGNKSFLIILNWRNGHPLQDATAFAIHEWADSFQWTWWIGSQSHWMIKLRIGLNKLQLVTSQKLTDSNVLVRAS